ncbi:MAG: hypothetical protein K8H75_14915 [Sulfuricella sp.]|nr:hypothetical protein [Sulfuricella sp.]
MKTAVKQPAQPDEYREWFNKEVELGLADIEAGRVVSHEEVRAKVEKLIVQHSKKAA